MNLKSEYVCVFHRLKNEVVAVKKDKETLEKLYEGKKNA